MKNCNKVLDNLWNVFYKYNGFEYLNSSISECKIKTVSEFKDSCCGTCWDFVGPMSNDLSSYNIIHHCYFTYVFKDDKLLTTHSYIIVRDDPFHFWIECAWQKHKGLHLIYSYRDVERQLKECYTSNSVYTVVYNPSEVYGYTSKQFFKYLEKEGIELS